MSKSARSIDKVRASRAGHTYHERWAARRALQLVFPKDDLHSVVIEGLSPTETMKVGKHAEDIADLALFYGDGETFDTCSAQQILQFKYKVSSAPETASYLKKTIQKFAATLCDIQAVVSKDVISHKLSFGFVTNAEFSSELWEAIEGLKCKSIPESTSAKRQFNYLKKWCAEENVDAFEIFPLIEFRASTSDLPAQNRALRRTVSDWSANSSGHAAKRLYALMELVREKAQIEGQDNNSITREDVLDALECDEDQLFPADTRFVDVGAVVERQALSDVETKLASHNLPVFMHADGGVGKTVFIQSLAAKLADQYEVVVFDCFGGGAYRSESKSRHQPRVGIIQIINELASRGICDPLLPSDRDQYALMSIARKRLAQASATIKNQSALNGLLVIIDASDNAQLEADARNEPAFPRLLLETLSEDPIEGVKLLMTARPHRMEDVIGKSSVNRIQLEPFTESETRQYLSTRRKTLSQAEFSKAFARSRGNARVLEYLVESWEKNVTESAPEKEILVEALIAQMCDQIVRDLDTAGWSEIEVCQFFAAIALLPPPIPLSELARALGWSESQVNSAAADLAPMLELVRHGAIFRDEPTETYIRDQYANERGAQQAIAQRLEECQSKSVYASEALPHFLVVIGDSERAYRLAKSSDFPSDINTEHGRRRLRLVRLHAAFRLATRGQDFDRTLRLTMKLSQAAAAKARGDDYIRNSPGLATILGDVDASRRLFEDRSGWRGARDARLIVSNSFSEDLDEASIHQNRTIGWINWYLRNDDENKHFDRSGPSASDLAAVIFLNVLKNDFASFNRNMSLWTAKFSLAISRKLIALSEQHQLSNRSEALDNLANFAASKECQIPTIQFCLLSMETGLPRSKLIAISRACSSLAQKLSGKSLEDKYDHELVFQSALSSAALNSQIINSKQSSRRIFKLGRHRRPSSYDYRERHGGNRIWPSIQSACMAAWSLGKPLRHYHLIPHEVKPVRAAMSVDTDAELATFLRNLRVEPRDGDKQKKKKATLERQFSDNESKQIVSGINCILQLIGPLQRVVLHRVSVSNSVFEEFISVWTSNLRPDVHWSMQKGRDQIARTVGYSIAKILFRHASSIEIETAQKFLELLNSNPFGLQHKLGVLHLLARRPNLNDVTGKYANALTEEILKDDYIGQRGDSFRAQSEALLPMSIKEAGAYYAQGLAQLDQMGGDDFDLVFSLLNYASVQPGGYVKPHLAHRLMNLCQSIFHDEPSKFGWTLFGRASAKSIGLSALYKLIRWSDQDVADYSYGVPQLASFLTKCRKLDPRRAAIFLSLSHDHGWHEWRVGDGLAELLAEAQPEDRQAIFSTVANKLALEHNSGGWEGSWNSVINCAETYDQIDVNEIGFDLKEILETAKLNRQRENAKYSSDNAHDRVQLLGKASQDEKNDEASAMAKIVEACDPTSASSLDEALAEMQRDDRLRYGRQSDFFNEMKAKCGYDERVDYLNAICESSEISFDQALDILYDCIDEWRTSTSHIDGGIAGIVVRLFDYKGSELFDLRYAGISNQLRKLGELCDDPKFVLQTALDTIAKERLALGGDEWLQLATSLSRYATPKVAKEAFEELLASSAANIGDEIGEGAYRDEYLGSNSDADVLVDIIWHLLGDSDAFIRWHVARVIKDMLELGLDDDVGRLLDRFDRQSNLALSSEDHHFSFLNAQQWLLMGLARASLSFGKSLKPLEARLRAIINRSDVHAITKIHLARCMDNISGSDLAQTLFEPENGTEARDKWPAYEEPKADFEFDYEFDKNNIMDLTRLFGITKRTAHDAIVKEIHSMWPEATDMSHFPGGYNPRREYGDRHESYREHVQRHAYLDAATSLQRSRPVVRASYDYSETNPWKSFLRKEDISFEDGSWLSDHKDRMPKQAQEYLLERSKRSMSQEILRNPEEIIRMMGFESDNTTRIPLYGHWQSPDDVSVRIASALLPKRGAVRRFREFAKLPNLDRWLPIFGSDGYKDRFAKQSLFTPLLWLPENYPLGIDNKDEFAASGAIGRPRIGRAISRVLGIKPDLHAKFWRDASGDQVLKSEVWGSWRYRRDSGQGKVQDEGELLWADNAWVDRELAARHSSLMFTINLSKYYTRRDYEDRSHIRKVIIGLKRPGESIRISKLLQAQ